MRETQAEFELRAVISSIKQYAGDHSLTAAQIKEIFDAGIVACSREGKIQIKRYSQAELEAAWKESIVKPLGKTNIKLKSALFVIATGAEKSGVRTKMNMQAGEKPERLDDAEYRKLAVEIVFNRLRCR